ncbi:hypothetical protein BOTBODRAFT_175903 [Botryobasidium botryosum FD-172 SS1]|uniref:Uncharacterized protein n=1 Tax=Botryobasidium botryosum (strain FD-172 SS1) TaxID=930990 RepID=A0A067ME93_BOTB1|nr:hypothetical protein BOTBODRAFT_175903 [Botryobasidium botryosum FD-172 SS1]
MDTYFLVDVAHDDFHDAGAIFRPFLGDNIPKVTVVAYPHKKIHEAAFFKVEGGFFFIISLAGAAATPGTPSVPCFALSQY